MAHLFGGYVTEWGQWGETAEGSNSRAGLAFDKSNGPARREHASWALQLEPGRPVAGAAEDEDSDGRMSCRVVPF